MQLDIILRVHDKGNVHATPRALDVPKADIVKRCVKSLGVARVELDTKVTVISDNCHNDTIISVVDSLVEAKYISLDATGNSASLAKSNELAVQSKADAVLLLEDDYLWEADGLTAMIRAWEMFSKLSPLPIALHPGTDYWDTVHKDICRVVAGPDRFWRTNQRCTGTMMISPQTIRDYRLTFDRLAETAREADSINRLWSNSVTLLTPLVPCSHHLNENKHPIYPYDKLWKDMK